MAHYTLAFGLNLGDLALGIMFYLGVQVYSARRAVQSIFQPIASELASAENKSKSCKSGQALQVAKLCHLWILSRIDQAILGALDFIARNTVRK